RDHACTQCGHRCLRKQDLARHLATHAKSRDFICHYGCGASFTRADALGRH
ncbi:hypothetical protein BC830DRAFT_1052630, partial [Chytriomyces sp. MP71]